MKRSNHGDRLRWVVPSRRGMGFRLPARAPAQWTRRLKFQAGSRLQPPTRLGAGTLPPWQADLRGYQSADFSMLWERTCTRSLSGGSRWIAGGGPSPKGRVASRATVTLGPEQRIRAAQKPTVAMDIAGGSSRATVMVGRSMRIRAQSDSRRGLDKPVSHVATRCTRGVTTQGDNPSALARQSTSSFGIASAIGSGAIATIFVLPCGASGRGAIAAWVST